MDHDLRYPAISDLRERARKRIPHFVFEYLDSATGIEDQMNRNYAAFRSIEFMPSILEGELTADLRTSFLGREYPLPFGMSPVGMSGIMWPGCEKILARAGAEIGIPYGYSTVATVRPETLAPLIGEQGWFQLYPPRDPEMRRDMLMRAKNAGFHTLILTVDVPVDSRRERQRRADLSIPPRLTPKMLWSMARHPAWTIGTLKEGIPSLKFTEDYVSDQNDFNSVSHALHTIKGNPSWDDFAAIRDEWTGPLVVKGVLKVADATRLTEMGADAIWVSNHTGRQFDGGPTSISCLPDIRAALPDTPLIYDSGIQGGLDILRAIALGADFVMLGRAFHYSVGALGAEGPHHLCQLLAEDMRSCMGQIGARRLSEVANHLIPPSFPGKLPQ